MAKLAFLTQILEQDGEAIVSEWLAALRGSSSFREYLTTEQDVREQCGSFLSLMRENLPEEMADDLGDEAFRPLREHLATMSDAWAELGFKPSDLAGFVMLLKGPVLRRLMSGGRSDSDQVLAVTRLLDQFGLWTAEYFQKQQAAVIERQQMELMELSTPVISLWDGILALPLIGTLDSARTQIVVESLLEKIVEMRADVAIIDITGVPTVDTMVAQHLLKAVTAARLMGAECIISGIRPSIAQTMVQLGVDLREVTTKSNLSAAFAVALKISGLRIDKAADNPF